MSEKDTTNLTPILIVFAILSYFEFIMYQQMAIFPDIGDQAIPTILYIISIISLIVILLNFILIGMNLIKERDQKPLIKKVVIMSFILIIIFLFQVIMFLLFRLGVFD